MLLGAITDDLFLELFLYQLDFHFVFVTSRTFGTVDSDSMMLSNTRTLELVESQIVVQYSIHILYIYCIWNAIYIACFGLI